MALGMEVGLGLVHIVLDGDTGPLPKTGGRAPKFSAHLYCGQTAGCIKMPLGSEVGLGLRRPRPTRHRVRCGPSYPQKKCTPPPPNFWPMFIVATWLGDEDAAWYRSRPRPRPHCTRRGPSSRERGTGPPPPAEGFPWDDLREIFSGCQWMAKVPNVV